MNRITKGGKEHLFAEYNIFDTVLGSEKRHLQLGLWHI